MGGRSLVIVILGAIVISSKVFLTLDEMNNDMNSNTAKYFERQAGQNIAQSGAHLALRQLANNRAWRTGFGSLTMLGGQATVTLVDTTFSGQSVVRIRSVGIMNPNNNKLIRRDTCTVFVPRGFVPGAVKGAITTNNPVTTLGNLIVDGRDHSAAGALIAIQGTNGIWTTKTFSQSGNSKIGGTAAAVDYVPAKPGNPAIIKTSQAYPGGYPGSPDSILGGPANGFPDGTLKALAQSGSGGSQYVSNPATLTSPLRGVTYVELPSGGIWQSMNIQGSGILVVHNQWKNAGMKNLNSGTFTGLMVVDDPVHIHTNIIGALIGLTTTPSEGNCIGNGNGTVYYSNEAIMNATAGLSASGNGSDANVIAWWE